MLNFHWRIRCSSLLPLFHRSRTTITDSSLVAKAKPSHNAKALYDYSRQTDEEVTFAEDAILSVFDTSDPDWTLVGVNDDYGFAPFNYIEAVEDDAQESSTKTTTTSTDKELPPPPADNEDEPERASLPGSQSVSRAGPAAVLAGVLGGSSKPATEAHSRSTRSTASPHEPSPEASDDELAPRLPQRPPSNQLSSPPVTASSIRPSKEKKQQKESEEDEDREGFGPSREDETPTDLRGASSTQHPQTPRQNKHDDSVLRSPGGFHLYNISEMVSAMGKRKKMPTTLGLNLATGTIMLSPEKTRDGPAQEWTAEKMRYYSLEGKHVFLELVRPSKSLDLHAGAKDTAEEIASTLGEIAGIARAGGLGEVMAAASGRPGLRAGRILYDFVAQGDDEVTVRVNDEVAILDDSRSEEWWMVRRLKNGNEGVVPSGYVELTGETVEEPPERSAIEAGHSTVEQNRREEERLTRDALQKSANVRDEDASVKPPYRESSLTSDGRRGKKAGRSESKYSKPRPDPNKTRTWTDRSGSFKVEAQFIGVSDGKIHLHKANGVKIAVPVAKMAPADLAYVEKVTRVSLDEDKPLGDLRGKRGGKSGASIEHTKQPEYDWFDFFLKAGVSPHQCERYAQNMNRDSMDESNLPDITPQVLRTLGLKEGDILRVMKHLDTLCGRTGKGEASGSNGGIFSGPGGTLHNNTRKTRPEAHRVVGDVVDPKAFEQSDAGSTSQPTEPSQTTSSSSQPPSQGKGFDDNAWEVKQAKPAATASSQPASSATSNQSQLTGSMAEMSLLSSPLQPTPAPPRSPSQPAPSSSPAPSSQPQHPQATGASPTFFGQLNPQATGVSHAPTSSAQQPSFTGQLTPSSFQQPGQANLPRQRPEAPAPVIGPGALLPPPPHSLPQRPLSAPQDPSQSNYVGPTPLQPQMTGIPNSSPSPAPPGQSLNDIFQQKRQQQPQNLQAQITGIAQPPPLTVDGQTGFAQQQPPQQPLPPLNGSVGPSPFADPRTPFQQPQQTGPSAVFNNSGAGAVAPRSINSVLPPPLQPQRTSFNPATPQEQQPQSFQQTGFLNPQPTGSLQPQQTGWQNLRTAPLAQQQQPQPTGPSLSQPQPTGFGQVSQPQQQPNGFAAAQTPTSFQAPSPSSIPSVPLVPASPSTLPLQPQKTGPVPPVRFGITPEASKLAPTPTGRRANLAHASKFLTVSCFLIPFWGYII